jgi:YD repeat-containing protein
VSQIDFDHSGTVRMTTSKQYDNLNRLTKIASTVNGGSAPTLSYNYAYNNANQRTAVTNADNSRWIYGYDALGQVNSGKKYWSDGTPVAGQQFEYGFENGLPKPCQSVAPSRTFRFAKCSGNRKLARSGGDQNGANLRLANYTNNTLNQLTGRDVPGYVDVMGLALGTNTITVNSQTPYRKGEYFREELSVANSSAPVWQSVSVAEPGETTVSGNVYVPKTAEMFG